MLQQAITLGGSRSLGRRQRPASNASTSSSSSSGQQLLHRRPLPPGLLASRPLLGKPPLFDLRGLAIGNGLTDPAIQVGGGRGVGWQRTHAFQPPGEPVAMRACSGSQLPPSANRLALHLVACALLACAGCPVTVLPGLQVMAHADTAFFQGYLDPQQRMRAMAMQLETVQLIGAGEPALHARGPACLPAYQLASAVLRADGSCYLQLLCSVNPPACC